MRLALAPCTTLLACFVSAQTIVIPNGTTATEGGATTAYPWGRGNAQIRAQYVFDSTHFTAQGINYPVVVSNLRYRANGAATTAGYTYGSATVQISTAAVDYLAPSTTFASNHGPDLATVYTGPVVVASGAGTTPNNWYVTLPITPFLYDPTQGDLCLDMSHDGVGPSTTTGPAHDCMTTGSLTSRITNLTSYTSPTGTTQQNVAIVVELTCAPASGLFAAFTANVTSGPSPLNVTFTDQSFTSDPGGVTGWAWDFNGDNIVDSNLQNPSFLYTGCGDFTVSLTVTDATHAPDTETRTGYIATDHITASFTWSMSGPNLVQFTDTSTPPPTSWAWDLDGDSVTDSTLQNPVWVYNGCTSTNATLSVNRLCRGPATSSRAVRVATTLATLTNGSSSFGAGAGNFFDANVTNPDGISVCGIDTKTTAPAGTPIVVEIYQTPGTYVGKEQTASAWRLIASGTGTGVGSGSTILPVPVTLSNPFYLASGSHGIFVRIVSGGGPQYSSTANVFSNSDLTLTLGASQSTPFSSAPATPRTWNGAFHYSWCTNTGDPGYGMFGLGCAGSMAVTRLTHANRPQIGTTLSVGLNNLPASVAIMVLGFSRTISAFGPLPVDLTPLGAPGCLGRVSPDANAFLFGASNTATWSLAIPSNPSLLCMQFFNQALVLDPGFNGLGAVMSDAAAGILGN